jgi:hypothetical protein
MQLLSKRWPSSSFLDACAQKLPTAQCHRNGVRVCEPSFGEIQRIHAQAWGAGEGSSVTVCGLSTGDVCPAMCAPKISGHFALEGKGCLSDNPSHATPQPKQQINNVIMRGQ